MRAKLRKRAVITGGYDPEYTRQLEPHNRFEQSVGEGPTIDPAPSDGGASAQAPDEAEGTATSAAASKPVGKPVPPAQSRPRQKAVRELEVEAAAPVPDEPIAPLKRRRTVGIPKARTEVLVCPTDDQAARVGRGDLPTGMPTIAALAMKRLRSTFEVDLDRPPEGAALEDDHERERFPAYVRIPEVELEAYRARHDPFAIETTARLIGGQIRIAFQAEVDAVIARLAARGR